MASADAISISMIIIGVPNTAGMVAITCLTVRSGVTVRIRSADMPTVMMSRASMALTDPNLCGRKHANGDSPTRQLARPGVRMA